MRIFSVTKDILVSLSLGSVRIEVNFNAHWQNCLLLVGGLRDLSLRSIPLTPRNKQFCQNLIFCLFYKIIYLDIFIYIGYNKRGWSEKNDVLKSWLFS